jgi:CRP/FNR family cyclic AMP-dependent transcriptional regulator
LPDTNCASLDNDAGRGGAAQILDVRHAMDDSTLLGSLQLFESLSEEDLTALARRLEDVKVPADTVIFKEGEPGGRLFVIEEGTVEISYGEGKERVTLATLAPGQYFGELSLFDGSPRSATATALKACSLLALDRDDFLDFVKKSPEGSVQIMGELAERIRQTNALFSSQVSKNVLEEAEDQATIGQRVADRVAAFGGSWPFIFLFGGIMAAWMTVNEMRGVTFDPYPFILLNLALSSLAALQAPIIMMSQNRQAAKDKLLAENDYIVNLKSEIGIQTLLRGQTELMARVSLLERQLSPVASRRS